MGTNENEIEQLRRVAHSATRMLRNDERICFGIAVAVLLLMVVGAFAQPPARKAATVGERMLSLGLASVNETGETVPAPRERVVAFIAEADEEIAFFEKRLTEKKRQRDWVQSEVLPRYPVPSPTPTPNP